MNFKFPTNKLIIENYSAINAIFKKELSKEFSQKQIFRLIDNLHYDHIKNLVEFIEKLLTNKVLNEYIAKKINSMDYQIFSNNLKELFLLNYLLKNKFTVIPFDNKKGNVSVPEFYAEKNSNEFLIELYSPIELYGFELFLTELQNELKYYPGDVGFNCSLEIKTKENSMPQRGLLPFEINFTYSNDIFRRDSINKIVEDIFSDHKNKTLKKDYFLTTNVFISMEINFKGGPQNRFISISNPSYDSIISFMNLDNNSKGFYRKLLKKIKYGQVRDSNYPSAMKTLFIDFLHSMGSEVLVEGLGNDFLSKRFYENIRVNLNKDVSPKDVDLIYPVLCDFDEKFFVGNCIFNPNNIDTIFNH